MIVAEQTEAGPSTQPDDGAIAQTTDHDDDVFAKPPVTNRIILRFRHLAGQIVDGWHGFRGFMWNKDTREVMGRDGKSWAQIGLFYLCFYTCLAAFWAAMFAIFYQTVSLEQPTYNSYITPPGLGVAPILNQRGRIEYGVADDDEDRLRYEHEIEEYVFDALSIDQSTYEDCPDIPDLPIASPPQQRLCRFNQSLLGPCAPANNVSYVTREPCLYFWLNRVWGWVPVSFTPDELKFLFNLTEEFVNRTFLTCDVHEEDTQHINFLDIYPEGGISFGHYPYVIGTDKAQQARYIRPVFAVKVGIRTPGVNIRIECRARAKNLPDEAPGGLFNSRSQPARMQVTIMVRE